MTRHPSPSRLVTASAAAAAVVALGVAGCTSGDSPDDSTSSSSSSSKDVEAAPANPGDPSSGSGSPSVTPQSEKEKKKAAKQMDPGDVDSKQLAAVRSYLKVRENSESTAYKDPAAWEKALGEVATDEGVKTAMAAYQPAEVSNARQVAQRLGYEVKVVVGECVENPGFGGGKDTLAVQCSLTDLVVDDDGKTVTSSDVDITWPYYGKRPSPTLVLAKEGGKWLVDGDYTGKVS